LWQTVVNHSILKQLLPERVCGQEIQYKLERLEVIAGRIDNESHKYREVLLQRDAEWSAAASAGVDIEQILSFWTDDAVVIAPGLPNFSMLADADCFFDASRRLNLARLFKAGDEVGRPLSSQRDD